MNKLIKILYGTGFVIATILAIVLFSSFTIEDSIMTIFYKLIALTILVAGAMFTFIQGFPNFFVDEDYTEEYTEDDVAELLEVYKESIDDLEDENYKLLDMLSSIPKMLNGETRQKVEAFINAELAKLYGFENEDKDKDCGKGDDWDIDGEK